MHHTKIPPKDRGYARSLVVAVSPKCVSLLTYLCHTTCHLAMEVAMKRRETWLRVPKSHPVPQIKRAFLAGAPEVVLKGASRCRRQSWSMNGNWSIIGTASQCYQYHIPLLAQRPQVNHMFEQGRGALQPSSTDPLSASLALELNCADEQKWRHSSTE